jgi:hypothetical protein
MSVIITRPGFLSDDDAMMLAVKRLKEIVELIKLPLAQIGRVSSYYLPLSFGNKTVELLTELKCLALKLMYISYKSGDDTVLALIEKGETYQSSLITLNKIKASGVKSSVMILNDLDSSELSCQHAINSAKLMNEAQPNFLSTLVVSFSLDRIRFGEKFTQGILKPFRHLTTARVIQCNGNTII